MFSETVINKMVDKNIFVTELCTRLDIDEGEFFKKILNPELLTIQEANILINILDLEATMFF